MDSKKRLKMDNSTQTQHDTYLRQKIREYARTQRQTVRSNATDALRFGLGQIKQEIAELQVLTENHVIFLALRFKERKHATSEDMYRLSHAFLQCNDNINVFAKYQGATQVLVKELTGASLERQMDAAECFCNYALGDAHVCEKITKLAGSYLVTYIDSHESRLKRSCLWALANLLATSNKAAKTLLQMQLLPKLWKLYTAPADDLNGCYQEDAGICLYLIASHAAELLSAEDRRYLAEHMHEKLPTDPATEYYMYIIFQSEIISLEPELCAPKAAHLLRFFAASLRDDFITPAEKLLVVYGVRVLANCFAKLPGIDLDLDKPQLLEILNRLFALRDESLTMDLLRLVRNFMELKLMDSQIVLDQLKVYAVPPLLCA